MAKRKEHRGSSGEYLCRADVWKGCRRSQVADIDQRASAEQHRHRHWRRTTGKAWVLSARKSELPAGHSLHWRSTWVRYWRPGGDPRLGRSILPRLVFAPPLTASPLHSTALARTSTAVAHCAL